MKEKDKQRTDSGGGWVVLEVFIGIDIVFVTGLFVIICVGCLVVSTNAPQLASLEDVVWLNGWSKNKSIIKKE